MKTDNVQLEEAQMNGRLDASRITPDAPESGRPEFSVHHSALRAGQRSLALAGLSLVLALGLLGLPSCAGKAGTATPKKEIVPLYPVPVNGMWGYINKTGKLVINPQFGDAKYFHDGLANVRVGDAWTGKWGFINLTGKWVVKPRFDHAGRLSEGLAVVIVGDSQTGVIGDANRSRGSVKVAGTRLPPAGPTHVLLPRPSVRALGRGVASDQFPVGSSGCDGLWLADVWS
jgi:hypothetical protein